MANLEQLSFADEPAMAVVMEAEHAAFDESLAQADQPLFQRTMADGSVETANSVEDVLVKCEKMRQLFKDHPEMALNLINMAAVTPKPENDKPKDNRDKDQAAKVEPVIKEAAPDNKLKTDINLKPPAELTDQSARTRTETAIQQNELAKAKLLSEVKETAAPIVKSTVIKKSPVVKTAGGTIKPVSQSTAVAQKVVTKKPKPASITIPALKDVSRKAETKTSPLLEVTAPAKEVIETDKQLSDRQAIETVIEPAVDTLPLERASTELPVDRLETEILPIAEIDNPLFDYLTEPTELMDDGELQLFYDQLENSLADATSVLEAVTSYEEQLAQDFSATLEPSPLDEIAFENLVAEFTRPDPTPEAKLTAIDPTETYELAALIITSLAEQTADTEVQIALALPPAVTERIKVLLLGLGYSQPAQILENYLDDHTLFELAEQLQAVADMQDHAFRMEFMRSLRTTLPKTNNIKQRFAQLLVFLMSRPTIAT